MKAKVVQGDSIEVLKTLPDNSIDAVVTDPPYGLSSHSQQDVLDCLQAWIKGEEFKPNKRGFMGAGWDAWVPGPEIWKECYRVLKPGGHMLVFAGTRSFDLMSLAIRLAGFEMRDTIGHLHANEGAPVLCWVTGQGFPKSMNVSKAVQALQTRGSCSMSDQRKAVMGGKYTPSAVVGCTRNNTERAMNCTRSSPPPISEELTEDAARFVGYGTALKPAYEPILMCRKPLEGTVAQNVLKHGTGAINIDGCRVSYEVVGGGNLALNPQLRSHINGGNGGNIIAHETERRVVIPNQQGRWPANIILSHSPDCKLRGMKKVRGTSTGNGNAPAGEEGSTVPLRRGSFVDRTDENGMEEVEDWECVEGCPIREFPESKTNRIEKPVMCDEEANTWGGTFQRNRGPRGYNESGSAARFFYCAKASRKERNAGLEDKEIGVGTGNSHPT